MSKVYLAIIDDGHGMETLGKRTPAFPDGSVMLEDEFNRDVAIRVGINLARCNVQCFFTAPEDTDVPLVTRTNRANATYYDLCNKFGKSNVAAALVSIHANANTGSWGDWGGIETHFYLGSTSGKALASAIHAQLIQGTSLRDRGLKETNLHMNRESVMPACLVECAFMDNMREATLLRTSDYRQECADEISKGLCNYFGIPYVQATLNVPSDFDENTYLAMNPDVAQAVANGSIASGAFHYANWGINEGRQYKQVTPKKYYVQTQDFDGWVNVTNYISKCFSGFGNVYARGSASNKCHLATDYMDMALCEQLVAKLKENNVQASIITV